MNIINQVLVLLKLRRLKKNYMLLLITLIQNHILRPDKLTIKETHYMHILALCIYYHVNLYTKTRHIHIHNQQNYEGM